MKFRDHWQMNFDLPSCGEFLDYILGDFKVNQTLLGKEFGSDSCRGSLDNVFGLFKVVQTLLSRELRSGKVRFRVLQ